MRRGSLRGSPQVRLRAGFVMIAMVLSVFGARLVQLQGLDPGSYAAMAAAEGTVDMVLPAERGAILDRYGEPLADSIEGLMIIADPQMTEDKAPEIATFLKQRLGVDYFDVIKRLRETDEGSRFAYVVTSNVSSLRTMPRKPTSALGRSRVMPSSMPRPALRIGTMRGFGRARRMPTVGATGVSISLGSTRTSRGSAATGRRARC